MNESGTSLGHVRLHRHGRFWDVVVDGRKVGKSFRNREFASRVAKWCKDALKPVTT